MRHRRNSEGEVEPLKGAAGSASPRPPNGAKREEEQLGADAEKLSEEMEMARQEVERTAGEALVHESSAMLHRGQAARDSVMAQKQQEAAMIRQQMEEQRKELIQKEKEEEERRKGVHEGVRKQRRASLVAVENLHTLKEEEAKALREQAMKTQAEAQAQLESVVFSRVMSQESDLQTVLAQRSTFSSWRELHPAGGPQALSKRVDTPDFSFAVGSQAFTAGEAAFHFQVPPRPQCPVLVGLASGQFLPDMHHRLSPEWHHTLTRDVSVPSLKKLWSANSAGVAISPKLPKGAAVCFVRASLRLAPQRGAGTPTRPPPPGRSPSSWGGLLTKRRARTTSPPGRGPLYLASSP
eukprot:CAMPEP_0114129286 /NCGR_PEP_ID=MMETSP0043_2-20121206/11394_1 /TAXON_ID=464988 /ORGANISM="Hemiselmis andersenii, Strain CCMP644" /LENGTH=351 /DNA_ID=CAMNT_0001222551 /DNA_START=183 /DNA_END=1235 /DNA_ORIENTATION=-